MLGLGSSLLQGGALRSIVRSGLQLFYKADRTQAPLGEEQVRNNSFDELGPDKIDNGNFETGIDGWTPNAGSEATITYNSQLKGIKFSNDGIVTSPTVRNDNSDTATGETYKLTYKVLENNNASEISIWNGIDYSTYNDLPVNVSDDEHVYYYTFSGSFAFDLYIKLETDESDITLSNIKLEKVDPNDRWETFNGATINITKANIVGDGTSFTNVRQANIFKNNKVYEIVADVTITSGLGLKFQDGANNENIGFAETTGVYTFNFTGTSDADLIVGRRTGGTAFDSSVNSISVKEITNSIKDHSRNSNDGILYSGKALDFDGTGDIVELNDANLTGEFTVCTWIKPDTFTNCVVFGDTGNEDWIRLQSATSITVKIAGNSTGYAPITHGGNIAQDEWSRLIVTRGSDNIVRFGINGTLYSPSTTARAGTFDFNLLGSKDGTEMNGALADVQVYDKAWNATDVKYDWENPDKDVFDRVGEAQVLGEEEVVNGDFANGTTGWTPATADTFEVIDGGTGHSTSLHIEVSAINRGAYQSVFVAGKTYHVSLDLKVVSGSVYIGKNTRKLNNQDYNNSDWQTITGTLTAIDDKIRIYGNNSSSEFYIDNISVKQVTTHASHILPADCKSLLRLNEGAGDRVYDAAPVLGEDLMESRNGSFELGEELNDLTWIGFGGWSTDGDIASNDGGGSTIVNDILEIGKTYQFKCKLSSYTSGTFRLLLGANTISSTFSGTDEFTFIGVCTGDSYARVQSLIEAGEGGIGSLSISSLTIKEVPNWVYASSVEIVDSGVFFNDDDDNIYQNFSYIDGATYAIGFEGTSDTGLIRYRTGFAGISNPQQETPIPGTAIWRPDSSSQRIQLFGPASGTATVSKVTIKQIKPAESFAIVGDKNFIHQQPYIPQYAMSSFSKKMLFDGSNDYVTGSFNGNIGPAKDITLSCWFSYEDSVTASGDRETLFGLLSSSSDGFPARKFEVGLFETNRIVVYTGDGTTATSSSTLSDISSPLSNNKLNHVAVSLSSSGVVNIYVNGVESATATHSNFGAPTITHYRIGSRTNTSLLNKGIIDEVSLFKSELTQDEVLELYNSGSSFDSTGHSKYNLGEEVSNGTFELGSEEVVDGGIDSISNWTFGDGWSLVDGKASLVQVGGPQAGDYLEQEITGLVNGRTYVIGFDLDITSATVTTIGISSTGAFGNIDSSLRFHETSIRKTITAIYDSSHASGTKYLRFVGGSNTEFTIDNVSVKEVPNWELRPGWSVNNNTATYNGTGLQYARIIQTLNTVVGRTYQMTFTLSGLSSGGTVNFGLGRNGAFNGYTQQTYSSNGTYTRIMQAQSIDDDIMVQVNQADANCTVSNISVQEYGLSAYWRNNGAAQWDDLSINSNHGTVSGSPTEIFLQEVPFFGKDSLGMFMNKPRLGGLNFNGSGYVEIHDTNDLDFPAATGVDNVGEFSVECWVRYKFLSQGSTVNCIYSNGEEVNDVNTFSLITNQDNKIGFYVNGTLCSSVSTFSLDEWVHVVGTREHGTNGVKLYINGNTTPEATATNNNTVTNSFNKRIGWDGHANRYLEGVVDDVKSYNRALTPAEIKKNYNATKGKHKN